MAEDTARHNFVVTAVLAAVCSLLVSLTAIGLATRQEQNRELDRKTKILRSPGSTILQHRSTRRSRRSRRV
jgi:Na+-transporting NADH:ubiquinone oxidoreductase subunit NqrC